MWTSACLRSTVSIVLEAQTEDLFLTVSLSFYWSCCVILIWDLSIRLLTCCHLSPFIPDLDFWVESLQRIHPCLRLSMDKGTPLPACSKVGVYQQSTKYHETSDFEVIMMDVQDPMLVRFFVFRMSCNYKYAVASGHFWTKRIHTYSRISTHFTQSEIVWCCAYAYSTCGVG